MKFINLSKAIDESDSKFLQKLPNFIINILKRIIHQEDLNELLTRVNHLKGVDFHNAVIKELNIKTDLLGHENLPENGHCFFFANHPYGIVDGLILTKTILDKYGDLRAIGNEAFKYIPNLVPYIAVVNAYGATSRDYILALEKVFASPVAITHFPAGEVSRKYDGKVQDREWRKSLVSKAVSHQRNLVPFYFHGHNSKTFLYISCVRKFFKLKLNLELALLPHEFFNKRNKTIKVVIGKPIPFTVFDDCFSQQEWTNKVKDFVYSLEKQPYNEFKP